MTSQKPRPVAVDVQADYLQKKRAFEEAFKRFHEEVFLSKVLYVNKSDAVKNTETQITDKMVNSAVALDNVNVGEGILALATVALREVLTVRDRANELEYELFKLLRDISKLKNKLDLKDDKKDK